MIIVTTPVVEIPAQGSRIVKGDQDVILFGQPPEVLKGLLARGISKNQVSAVYLTHLHDDHCAMFPLMLMPHLVEVITTREIFFMVMEDRKSVV